MFTLFTISSALTTVFSFINRFMEGGPVGMTLVLICLILALVFIALASGQINKSQLSFDKYKSLAKQASLLGLVIGLFNSIVGLINAFDAIEAVGDVAPAMVAGGLKVALLSPLFGFLTFIIGRTGTFILDWINKENLNTSDD